MVDPDAYVKELKETGTDVPCACCEGPTTEWDLLTRTKDRKTYCSECFWGRCPKPTPCLFDPIRLFGWSSS